MPVPARKQRSLSELHHPLPPTRRQQGHGRALRRQQGHGRAMPQAPFNPGSLSHPSQLVW
ncbi:hypothetical protein T484DRAFT_1973858 [Baffinella frigidus]|nr:hypothetical protein T484DRAFT_1973858 [Cryptophyta sp. CCMP2293]